MFQKIKTFLFTNKNINQVLTKNTFWIGFGEITSRLLKLIIILYAIKRLGVNDWGIFSYALSLCSLFMMFSDLGLSSILTRELSKNDSNSKKYIATSFLIKISLNILIYITILLLVPIFSHDSIATKIIPMVALLIIFDSIRDFIFSINRAFEKMETEAFIKIIANLLLITFTYLFLVREGTIFSLIKGYFFGNLAGLIFTLIVFRRHFKNVF